MMEGITRPFLQSILENGNTFSEQRSKTNEEGYGKVEKAHKLEMDEERSFKLKNI